MMLIYNNSKWEIVTKEGEIVMSVNSKVIGGIVGAAVIGGLAFLGYKIYKARKEIEVVDPELVEAMMEAKRLEKERIERALAMQEAEDEEEEEEEEEEIEPIPDDEWVNPNEEEDEDMNLNRDGNSEEAFEEYKDYRMRNYVALNRNDTEVLDWCWNYDLIEPFFNPKDERIIDSIIYKRMDFFGPNSHYNHKGTVAEFLMYLSERVSDDTGVISPVNVMVYILKGLGPRRNKVDYGDYYVMTPNMMGIPEMIQGGEYFIPFKEFYNYSLFAMPKYYWDENGVGQWDQPIQAVEKYHSNFDQMMWFESFLMDKDDPELTEQEILSRYGKCNGRDKENPTENIVYDADFDDHL
jgi:hypothetical protein